MSHPGAESRAPSLSTGAPGEQDFRLALAIGVFGLIGLVALAPYAAQPLPHFAAFTPAYDAWTGLSALVTTLLLLGQVTIIRSKAVLALTLGYVSVALTTILHFLAFPGNVSADGLFGGGRMADWMGLTRSFVLPATVIAYVVMGGASAEIDGEDASSTLARPERISPLMAGAAALVLGWGALPLIVLGAQGLGGLVSGAAGDASFFTALNQLSAVVGIIAMAALVGRRVRTRFDLWLLVTLLAWVCDVVLAGVLSHGTFDLGWYGGCAFGGAASSALLVALLFESANHFRQLAQVHDALLVSNRSLEHLSLHDSLTGLANRRYFDTYLGRQASLMRRHGRDLALVLCDIDNFKAYNDHYGHQAGDECLASIAGALRTCCRRPTDLAARYGGEEFALILPETDLAGAVRIAEAAREAVAHLKIANARSESGPIMTLSGGVAILGAGQEISISDLVAAADSALFEAKRQGRNRIVSTKPHREAA